MVSIDDRGRGEKRCFRFSLRQTIALHRSANNCPHLQSTEIHRRIGTPEENKTRETPEPTNWQVEGREGEEATATALGYMQVSVSEMRSSIIKLKGKGGGRENRAQLMARGG